MQWRVEVPEPEGNGRHRSFLLHAIGAPESRQRNAHAGTVVQDSAEFVYLDGNLFLYFLTVWTLLSSLYNPESTRGTYGNSYAQRTR